MDFRPAGMRDLVQLKIMYRQIVQDMNAQGIRIWDEIYPCEFLEEDIKMNRLYVLLDGDRIVSAFALSATNSGESTVQWMDDRAKALYIDRLGVDTAYSKQGIGSFMLARAKEITKAAGAEYLRLFVVDINEPAIRLYRRNGFAKADGVYEETFPDGFALHEYGYEIKVESSKMK
ncbi:MAG: GNAT family N-acetyltransferase [Clostridia bacterium]|nr:GNAT family N-acetyltransferase [Clostridia bacterium]